MRINRLLPLLTLLLFAFATDGRAQVDITGFVEYDNITYLKNLNKDQVNGRNQAILQLELFHQVNDYADIFSSVEFREDQADPNRNRIYIDEAYLNLYFDNLDIKLGKQIYSWGRADGFNPTDNLSSWDFTDILDIEDEKIGVISARADYYIDDWTITGVVLPTFTESLLPQNNSRWYPSEIKNPFYPFAGGERIGAKFNLTDPVKPDEIFSNLQYALKLSGTLGGWDFSLSWFDGYDDLPALHTQAQLSQDLSEIAVTAEPVYHRRKSVGADFATIIGDVNFRGEAAYYITEDWEGKDPFIDDPYFQYVLGADYTFNDLIGDNDLFVLLEWVQEIQTPDRNTVYQITDLNHIFRKTVMGKLDFKFDDYSKLYVNYVWNIETKDWYFQPGIDVSITDGVQLRTSVDLLGGEEDSFFGTYKDNNRVQVRLKYSF